VLFTVIYFTTALKNCGNSIAINKSRKYELLLIIWEGVAGWFCYIL